MINYRKLTWMAAACGYALLGGAPAVADDTELFLVAPDPTNQPKANVLFILDSSGSMDTEQETIKPFDDNLTYTGDCEPTSYYWTDVDVTPDCATSTNVIEGDKYLCAYSANQIAGIGSFTNTMVQYRAGGVDGTTSETDELWQYLAPGYASSIVECQADFGDHGDGVNASRLWPAAGTNLSEPFTDVESEAVAWGGAPRNLSYTVYSGNYLNWKANPELVNMERTDIM